MSARKTLKNSSILNSTPTQQPSLSPSRKKITKSPLSTSKFLAQSNNRPNVSYGELQIVLQNIQQIRVKANNQVKALLLQNNQLKEELAISQETIKNLNEKIGKYQQIQNQADQKAKWQLSTIQNHKGSLQTQIQSKEKRIIYLEVKSKELQKEIQNQINKVQTKNREIEECKNKWKWAFTILAGNEERAEEMIWKVKNEYKGGLWTIIETYAEKEQLIDHKNQQIIFLQKQVDKYNDKNCQTSALLDRCREELNNSKIKIAQYEQQVMGGQQKSTKVLSLNQKLHLQIDQLKLSAEETSKKHRAEIQQKNERITAMMLQLLQKEKAQNEMRKKIEYENLIDELCNDSQQSAQLLQRVRYLQKFRSQHFFNIQKIQFLCKLLDN